MENHVVLNQIRIVITPFRLIYLHVIFRLALSLSKKKGLNSLFEFNFPPCVFYSSAPSHIYIYIYIYISHCVSNLCNGSRTFPGIKKGISSGHYIYTYTYIIYIYIKYPLYIRVYTRIYTYIIYIYMYFKWPLYIDYTCIYLCTHIYYVYILSGYHIYAYMHIYYMYVYIYICGHYIYAETNSYLSLAKLHQICIWKRLDPSFFARIRV